MGERAIVVFTHKWSEGTVDVSPGIYLHSIGYPEDIRELLDACGNSLRKGDSGYSAAHFCGVCYRKLAGRDDNLLYYGLGLFNLSDNDVKALQSDSKETRRCVASSSYGLDHEFYIIDTDTGSVTQIDCDGNIINRGTVTLGDY